MLADSPTPPANHSRLQSAQCAATETGLDAAHEEPPDDCVRLPAMPTALSKWCDGPPGTVAAGVPLAALLKAPERFQGKTVVVVLCDANLSLETLKTILA